MTNNTEKFNPPIKGLLVNKIESITLNGFKEKLAKNIKSINRPIPETPPNKNK